MASRHSARLASANLSPEQLCAFIDELAPLLSDTALRVAEAHAARLVEQPEWVLSEVLLSPDLVPHILAQLPTKAHAAKGTCRAWRRGWKVTLKKRERPCLLVIGGLGNEVEFLNSLERYDPSTNVWEEEAVAPMPTARGNAGTALFDGKLYVAGGKVNDEGHGATSNLVERYDLATKAWDAVAPMVTPHEGHNNAVLDGKLYAVGGSNGDGGNSSVERYDPAANAWQAVAPMGEKRSRSAAAALDGKLYAVGGSNNDGGLSSVERYDPALDAWEAVAPMASARSVAGVAVLDGKLYAVGGFNHGQISSSVERYDPATNAWEEVAPMAEVRCAHATAVLDGKLYAVGALGPNADLSSVERYDPAVGAWQAVAPMATARAFAVALLM